MELLPAILSECFPRQVGQIAVEHKQKVHRPNNGLFTALSLIRSERSVLVKGLKFVPSPGSLDLFSVKTDTESFFKRLYLKAHFHNQASIPEKDVFEAINHKKSTWSPLSQNLVPLDHFMLVMTL